MRFRNSNFVVFTAVAVVLGIILPLSQMRAQFKGKNFAENLVVNNVKAEIELNDFGQRVFSLLSAPLQHLSNADIAAGWVSWSFVPADIAPDDEAAIKQYVLDKSFGFTNDPNNSLIDDNNFIDDEPVRLVIFSWNCLTEGCDTLDDMSELKFVSAELENYHRLEPGHKIKLNSTR